MKDILNPAVAAAAAAAAALQQTLNQVTPSQWCQAYYLFAAGAVAAVAALPKEARRLLVDYGARRSSSELSGKDTTSRDVKAEGRGKEGNGNWLLSLINTFTSYGQVPHSWFITFYVASVACSVLWVWQFVTEGRVLRGVASHQPQAALPSGGEVTLGQVALAWTMMFLQGSRRLYEDWLTHGKSKSTMWIVHWVLGLSYYLVTSVAVWVEGSGAILDYQSTGAIDGHVPGFKTLVGIVMFGYASINQYRCHRHLAGLNKYSLPELGLFRYLVCPHYFCECLVYLSLAIIAAPKGELLNKTLLGALAFVVVNLGVTASGTRKWAQFASQLGDLQDITICEADPNSPLVLPSFVQRRLPEETPVCNRLLRHVHIGRKRVNTMKVLSVQVRGSNQQAARLLQNPPYGLRINGAVFFGLVKVEAKTRPETHCADHGMVRRSILMRHDARVGRIFVNKNMVRSAVRAVSKNVLPLLVFVIATALGRRRGYWNRE
ncbi:hypothetical protein B0T20DRAFT_396588 [Sordaria brevicollis]|uniref:3-oxo-5-alpha-steroid 4-dehydrogenase C-terminal domain-containing protein n=1 Tax=Sordaria brevicollis TaxID=83679 RepID=A0AAE0U699_SORBR|nr:hypothetical protein B0T20DRAFT_396588 [Sordaria brevicollis]